MIKRRVVATVLGGLLLAAVGVSQATGICTIKQCGQILECSGRAPDITGWNFSCKGVVGEKPLLGIDYRNRLIVGGGFTRQTLQARCPEMFAAGVCTTN